MYRSIFLLFSLFTSCSAWAGTDEAIAFYEKKDYANAYAEFLRMAEIGDHLAQFNIGAMYYRGQYVAEDVVQAYAWIALAGQTGQKPWSEVGAKVYATLDAEQKHRADDARQALFEKFSDAVIARRLAPDLSGGSGAENPLRLKQRRQAKYPRELENTPGSGWVDILYAVATDGTTRNHMVLSSTGAAYTRAALDAIKGWQFEPPRVNGKPVEVFGEQQSFHFDVKNNQYDERRVRNLESTKRRDAERGSAVEHYAYAHFLEILPSYTGIQFDNSDYNNWYWRAAQEGYGPAQFSLARNLLYGRACAADTAKSLYWLELSAGKGQPDSQYLLAVEMISGVRMTRNLDVALKWLRRAAESNNQHAQLKLAWFLVTSADEGLRDVGLAKEYVARVDDEYADKLSLFETRAAVAAAAGDFKAAVAWQRKTVAEAQHYELPLDGFAAKLAAYSAGKPWVEPI